MYFDTSPSYNQHQYIWIQWAIGLDVKRFQKNEMVLKKMKQWFRFDEINEALWKDLRDSTNLVFRRVKSLNFISVHWYSIKIRALHIFLYDNSFPDFFTKRLQNFSWFLICVFVFITYRSCLFWSIDFLLLAYNSFRIFFLKWFLILILFLVCGFTYITLGSGSSFFPVDYLLTRYQFSLKYLLCVFSPEHSIVHCVSQTQVLFCWRSLFSSNN